MLASKKSNKRAKLDTLDGDDDADVRSGEELLHFHKLITFR